MSLSYSTQRLAVGHSKSHLNCRPYATLQSPFGTSTAALSCGDGSPYPPFAFGIESNMASAVPSARRTPKKRNAGHFPPYLHREDCPGKKSKPTPSGIQAVAPKKSLFRVRIQAIAARYLVTQQDQLSEIKLDRRAGKCESWRACIHVVAQEYKSLAWERRSEYAALDALDSAALRLFAHEKARRNEAWERFPGALQACQVRRTCRKLSSVTFRRTDRRPPLGSSRGSNPVPICHRRRAPWEAP